MFRSRWRCSPLQCAAAKNGGRRRRIRGEDTSLSGRSWEEIAADLARDADVYGTHPYATTFRALHIAVAALPDDLRAALLGLAVFPPDSAVPVAAIARYWAHTRGRSADETVADLDRLIAAEVLQRGADTDTIGFHDLAHEYLLLHADALPTLHEQLLDAYRGLLDESDQWWTLPLDEPYIWEHLTAHLAGAGDRDTLVATVTDPAYQAQRIARDGPHAGEADLAVAARVVPDDPVVAWWRAWLAPARSPAHGGHRQRTRRGPGRRDDARLAGGRPVPPRRGAAGRLAPLLPRPYLAVHGGLTAESAALVRVLTGTPVRRATRWPGPPTAPALATAGGDDQRSGSGTPPPAHTITTPHRPHRLGARRGLVSRRHPPRHRRPRRHRPHLGRRHRHTHRHSPATPARGARPGLVARRHPPGHRQLRRHRRTCGTPPPAQILPPAHRPHRLGERGGLVPRRHPPGHRQRTTAPSGIWNAATGQTSTSSPATPRVRAAGLVPRRHPPRHRQRDGSRPDLEPRDRTMTAASSPATPRRCEAVAWSPDGTRLATAARTARSASGTPPPATTTAHRPHRRVTRRGLVPRRHPARHRQRRRTGPHLESGDRRRRYHSDRRRQPSYSGAWSPDGTRLLPAGAGTADHGSRNHADGTTARTLSNQVWRDVHVCRLVPRRHPPRRVTAAVRRLVGLRCQPSSPSGSPIDAGHIARAVAWSPDGSSDRHRWRSMQTAPALATSATADGRRTRAQRQDPQFVSSRRLATPTGSTQLPGRPTVPASPPVALTARSGCAEPGTWSVDRNAHRAPRPVFAVRLVARTALASPARATTASSGLWDPASGDVVPSASYRPPDGRHSVGLVPRRRAPRHRRRHRSRDRLGPELREVTSLSAQAVPVSRLVRAPDSPSANPAAPRSSNSATPPTSTPDPVRQPPARAETGSPSRRSTTTAAWSDGHTPSRGRSPATRSPCDERRAGRSRRPDQHVVDPRVRLARLRRVRVRPAPGDSSISRIGVPPGVDQHSPPPPPRSSIRRRTARRRPAAGPAPRARSGTPPAAGPRPTPAPR